MQENELSKRDFDGKTIPVEMMVGDCGDEFR